jgi:hypothetical protein
MRLFVDSDYCGLIVLLWLFTTAQPFAVEAQDARDKAFVDGQEETRTPFLQMLMGDVGIISKLLRPALTPEERAVFDDIEFVYPDDPTVMDSPEAYIVKATGKRIVCFGTGFYRSIIALGDLNMIQAARGGKFLIPEYMPYVIDSMVTNSFLPPSRKLKIKWASDWAGVDRAAFLSMCKNEELFSVRTETIVLTVAFIYAHEIAHHVLDHVKKPPKSLEESRQRETAADAWACDTLVRADILPIGGILGAMMFYFFDREAIKHEELRDHPADLRRMQAVLKKTLDALEQFRERAEIREVNIDELKKQAKQWMGELTDRIKSEESGTD